MYCRWLMAFVLVVTLTLTSDAGSSSHKFVLIRIWEDFSGLLSTGSCSPPTQIYSSPSSSGASNTALESIADTTEKIRTWKVTVEGIRRRTTIQYNDRDGRDWGLFWKTAPHWRPIEGRESLSLGILKRADSHTMETQKVRIGLKIEGSLIYMGWIRSLWNVVRAGSCRIWPQSVLVLNIRNTA